MKIISLIPGSPEWIKSRSASKAPAMMGDSLYQTRSQLLHQMATGITKDVDSATQARLDNGHRTEALSRKLAEEIIGEELAPISAASDDDYLTANFDGITFLSNIGYEHKDWNEKLAASVRDGVVPDSNAWQLDQQIEVGNLEYVLFVVSDGTKERFVSHKYYPNQTRIDMLLAGWKVFDADLAAYVPPEVIPEVVAAPIKDLPSITYKMDGMHLSTNLRNDVKPAILALVEQSRKPLETDQDFADLDALCKKFKQAEEQCALVQSQAVGEIKDVDAFCRDLKELAEIMRQARIAGEKAVTLEKDARKLAILTKAKAHYAAHISALEAETKPITLQIPQLDLAGAMKGLKKLSAMQEAVDNALRNGKMLADSAAQDVRAKLAWYKETALSHNFLFHDLQQIIVKQADDFKLLVTTRIEAHKKAEAEKAEAAEVFEAARIKAEQEAKAKNKAESDRIASEVTRLSNERIAESTKETRAAAEQEAAAIEARRKQSKPFTTNPHATSGEPWPFKSKPDCPSDKAIIEAVQSAFGVSYGVACDYILEVAENLVVSP